MPKKQNRWTLLDVAPTIPQEIALVPCDGCHRNPHLFDVINKIATETHPHCTVIHSLPSLLFNKGPAAHYRYENANAKLTISGCEENCSGKLMDAIEPSQHILRLTSQMSPEEQHQAISSMIRELCLREKLTIDTAWNRPPAARVPQRRRFIQPESFESLEQLSSGESATFFPINPQEPVTISSLSEVTPAPPHITPTIEKTPMLEEKKSLPTPPRQQHYFSRQERSRKWPWILGIALLLVISFMLGRLFNAPQTPPPTQSPQPSSTQQPPKTSKKRIPPRKIAQIPAARPKPRLQKLKSRPRPRRPKTDPLLLIQTKNVNAHWIGGVCEEQETCRYRKAICLTNVPLGYCTRLCQTYCPNSKGKHRTRAYCVDTKELRKHNKSIPSMGMGLCMTSCNFELFPKRGCRLGASCQAILIRRRQGNILKRLCIPLSNPQQ